MKFGAIMSTKVVEIVGMGVARSIGGTLHFLTTSRYWERRRTKTVKQGNNGMSLMMCMCYYTGRGGLFM